jgi:hypothetical protein
MSPSENLLRANASDLPQHVRQYSCTISVFLETYITITATTLRKELTNDSPTQLPYYRPALGFRRSRRPTQGCYVPRREHRTALAVHRECFVCVFVLPPALAPWDYQLWPCHTVLQRPVGYPFFESLSLCSLCPSLPHRAVSHDIKTARTGLQRRCAPLFCAFTPNVRREPLLSVCV